MIRSRSHRYLGWAALLAYMGVIFYLSHQPQIPVPMRFPHQDKLLHFLAYFVMGALAAHAIYPGSVKKRFWWALFLASAYGASDEFHQSFVPGRDVDVLDWVADTAGGWFGAFSYLRAVRFRQRGGLKPGAGKLIR